MNPSDQHGHNRSGYSHGAAILEETGGAPMTINHRGYECSLATGGERANVVNLKGLLGVADADVEPILVEWVSSLRASECVIDLTGTTYIDEFGAGLITLVNGLAAERGIPMKVVVGWGQVKRKLQRLGLKAILEIDDRDG